MKAKVLSLLTALALSAGLCCVPAAAEELPSGTTYVDITASSLDLPRYSNSAIIAYNYNDGNGYVLIDPQGNVLSDTYSYISSSYSENGFFKVENETIEGVHDEGLIDSHGNVVIPLEYAEINIVSSRWQYGVKLTPSTEADKDYTFTIYGRTENAKEYYRIDTVDFYFDGQLAGTLDRSAFGQSTVTPYGAYIMVTNRAGYRDYYNSKMEKSPYQPEYSGEFDSSYKNGTTTYIHNGTGEKAFVPEFTVPLEDLDNPYIYDKAVLYDAHGNVVFNAPQNYDSIRRFSGDYAIVRMNQKCGLINRAGQEIIPVEYDDLGNYENSYLRMGCISAVKDGKFGFLDAQGNVTSDFVYSSDIVKNKGTFATIQNLDGTTIVLSGMVGELPEHYAETDFPDSYSSYAFIATNAAGEKGIVDLYGNTMLPFSSDYSYLDVNVDGTLAVVKYDYYTWRIYSFDRSAAPAPAEETPEETVPEPAATEEPVVADTTEPAATESVVSDATEPAAPEAWTCSNGHEGNTGKFCSECGEARPSEPETEAPLTACPSCGYEFEEGASPKFCPECGTKLIAE